MSVIISDEILQASQLTAAEFRQDIALYLCQTGCLTIDYAIELAEIPLNSSRQLLKQRKIKLHL